MGEPAFFVLGAGRSGTSILQEVLSLHGRLLVSHELRVLELAVLTGALFDYRGDPRIDERAPRSPEGLELGSRFVALLGEEQLRAAGKAGGVYGDKYPPYGEQIALLDRLWPRARFVHILRDGRDVVSSAIGAYVADRGWRRSPEVPAVEALASQWTRQVRTAREYASRLPRERYHELRYEELTVEPARVLAELLGFLGLEPDGAFDEMVGRMRPGKSWRETLSRAELARFESVGDAAALNRDLGYEPTPPGCGADAASAAEWAERGAAALGRGDERAAVFASLRALLGPEKDLRGAHTLLAMPRRKESLFAAMHLRASEDDGAKEALAAWMTARGLDQAAARAALGPGGPA
jgi:hypothetical protein